MVTAQPIPDPGPGEHARQRLYAAHTAAASFYRAQLRRCDTAAGYLRGRGLGALVTREYPWRVGYAPPGWRALTEHLLAGGFTGDELLAAGLCARAPSGRLYDLFRDRVVFPIRDTSGQVLAFIGRPPADAVPDGVPKYLNSPDTAIYDKGALLFGLAEQADRVAAGWPPVLVEGPIDTIAVWLSYARTGPPGRVGLAPCGTALTAGQVATAAALPGARHGGLTVAFDGDEAGRKAADRAFTLLGEHPCLNAWGVEMPAGDDPGALVGDPAGRARLRYLLGRGSARLLHLVLEHRLDRWLRRSPRLLAEIEGRWMYAQAVAPQLASRPAPEIMAAVEHLWRRAAALAGPEPAGELLHALSLAVVEKIGRP